MPKDDYECLTGTWKPLCEYLNIAASVTTTVKTRF